MRASNFVLAVSLCATLPLAAQAPDEQWYGEHMNDHLGTVTEIIGDVDNDCVRDLAIASPDADREIFFPLFTVLPDMGRVQIRSGATGALLYNWYGTVIDGLFGYAVSDAGDIDQDGHDDVLVGMPYGSGPLGDEGLVQLRSGATGGVIRTHYGTQRFSRFGHSIAGGSNLLEFDHHRDYAIGAPFYDVNSSTGGFDEEGKVYVFSGATGLLVEEIAGGTRAVLSGTPGLITYEAMLQHVGWSLDSRHARLVIGAPNSDRQHIHTLAIDQDIGAVMYVSGASGSFETTFRTGSSAGIRMGYVVGMGSEMPSGERQIVVGTPNFNGYGLVDVYTPILPVNFAQEHWEYHAGTAGQTSAPIGEVAAFVGDLDHDDIEDYAIGIPLFDFGAPFTITNAGRVRVFSGADGSLLSEFGSSTAGDRHGASVSGGDINGDGVAELLVGVTHDDDGSFDAGAAWFYLGEGCPPDSALYGEGWPGTLGVPNLVAITPPTLGSNFQLFVGNSLGAPSQAWLFLGFSPAAIPFKDGTLLVDAFKIQSFPVATNGTTLWPALPDDDELCHLSAFLQVLVIDPGATRGVAFSGGLELILGY
ncbi:MAG: hypothetical protein DHS20C15_19130 [Planctomycetota bacterium]|nr:MAG: hypothetical protein DHS20C15_19130 [Planctomycetota bacterium]